MTTQEPQPKKKRFLSLRVKIWIGFVLIFTPVFLASYYWFYQYTASRVLTSISTDLVDTITGAATGMNVDDMIRLYEEESANNPLCPPELGAEVNGYYPEGEDYNQLYWDHVNWLKTVQGIEPKTRMYTYINGFEPGEIIAIGSTGVFREPRGGFRFCQRYTSTSSRIYEGLSYRVDSWEIYEDSFGRWITTYMPLTDSSGKNVGAIGVDISADYVEEVKNGILVNAAITFVGSYIIIFILVYLISGVVTRPLINLTGAAEKIGEGDYDVELTEMLADRVQDEIDTLANVFSVMVDKVRAREQKLLQQVARLRIEIDETKKQAEVSDIVDTDFFKHLQSRANRLRSERKKSDKQD